MLLTDNTITSEDASELLYWITNTETYCYQEGGHEMIKGKRVYLDDLVEEYPFEQPYPIYATFHRDRLMDGPFTVIAAGKRRIAVRSLDGTTHFHFCGDVGLIGNNPTNATFEILPKPRWVDDWM